MEESFKDSLKEFRNHSKILAYDWTNGGDADAVVSILNYYLFILN